MNCSDLERKKLPGQIGADVEVTTVAPDRPNRTISEKFFFIWRPHILRVICRVSHGARDDPVTTA